MSKYDDDDMKELNFDAEKEKAGKDMSAEEKEATGAFDLDLVREFLTRYFSVEAEIKSLQEDKSDLRAEFKGRGLDVQTINAAIAIAKKERDCRVSPETLASLVDEVKGKLGVVEVNN